MAALCRKLEERYISTDYRDAAFKSHEILRHENDPLVIETLDKLLCADIVAKSLDRIHIAPPKFVEDKDRSFARVEVKSEDGDAPTTDDDMRITDLVEIPRRRLRDLTSDTVKR